MFDRLHETADLVVDVVLPLVCGNGFDLLPVNRPACPVVRRMLPKFDTHPLQVGSQYIASRPVGLRIIGLVEVPDVRRFVRRVVRPVKGKQHQARRVDVAHWIGIHVQVRIGPRTQAQRVR